jgi:hypothetical protein
VLITGLTLSLEVEIFTDTTSDLFVSKYSASFWSDKTVLEIFNSLIFPLLIDSNPILV